MIYVLLLGLPVLVFTVFGVSLIRFLCLRRRQKREPEGVDDALLRRLKLCAMVSGAIAGLCGDVHLCHRLYVRCPMKDKIFSRVMAALVLLGLLLTAAHAAYALYAYQNCSIIYFVAEEPW